MADTEESCLFEDSEGPSTSYSSERLLETCSIKAVPEIQRSNGSASSPQPASRKKRKTQNSTRLIRLPENPSRVEAHWNPSGKSSVKSRGPSKLPMPKIDLKALFDYHSRRRQRRNLRRPRKKVVTELQDSEPPKKRPRRMVSIEERNRRDKERHFQFAFVPKLYGKKHVPLKMECQFEEAALSGFFKYIEMLKYEDHLKKALKELDAADDLERECLDSRKHKYLDDEGPLSPIEETDGEGPNENGDAEDIGAKIVDNSCFILSSTIPKKRKKKSKMMSNVPLDSVFQIGSGRRLPGEMASLLDTLSWKQWTQESSLCLHLLDWKDVGHE